MIIHNNLKLLNNISEIEKLIQKFEEEIAQTCPNLNTKKFLEIVFSQVLEKSLGNQKE